MAIVFKDLQKLVSQSQQQNSRKELFQRLHGKPFGVWDKQQHKLEDIKTGGDCCFNRIIGKLLSDDFPISSRQEV